MSQPVRALAPLPFELVLDDGEPLETNWHAQQIPLMRHLIRQAMTEQGRADFFAGGNNFVYYSVEQAREVFQEEEEGGKQRAFRGPDVFWVGGVDPAPHREAWISWEEDGRLPDFILELLSPKTARKDRTVKKDLYARVFGTSEYFLYDPRRRTLEGFRLAAPGVYRPLVPDARGRFRSEQLGVSLGLWHGTWDGREDDWLRLFRPDGSLVPTRDEAAEQEAVAAQQEAVAAQQEAVAAQQEAVAAQQEAVAAQQEAVAAQQRAEAERQRADAAQQRAEAERRRAELAEAELARLRAVLEERDAG